MLNPLERIRSVADFQFGKGVGLILFPQKVELICSKRTGRVRYVYFEGVRLVTLRSNGLFSLSIHAAEKITRKMHLTKCIVTVREDIAKFIGEGRDVFAAHVIRADFEIRAKDEVIVVDPTGNLLAVGRAVLSGEEMKAFKIGVAVKVRRGRMLEG